jgi:hypothetical protein
LKTEAVGVTHDAGGFFEFRDISCPSHVHHYASDIRCGFFLSRRNLIPETPAFGCLALQYAFRHYCGSDGVRWPNEARGKIIGSIINT